MSKITQYCHREVNSVKCICGYVGTNHTCDFVIYATITIDFYPKNLKVFQEEVNESEHHNFR